jgi:hypothetical protein
MDIDWEYIRKQADRPLRPEKLLMHADDFRDLLVWGFVEDGMSEDEALAEANRRMDAMGTDEEPSDASIAPKE